MPKMVRVWDLPTRVFHWALAACFVGMIASAQIGGEAMAWHFRVGYTVLSLLLFRLIWGVLGGHWSRFSSYIFSPTAVLRQLKGQGRPECIIGHSPLGAGSVFAMLGFLLLQVATGLISDDEIATAGPFSKWVASAWVTKATFYHAEIGKLIVIGLVLLHIGAILFYRFKKGENLVRAMILGDKESAVKAPSSRDDASSRTLAAALFLGCAGLVAGLLKLAA